MQYVANDANSHLAYVLERAGRIRVLVDDVLQVAPVLDISAAVITPGECGLQGMTLAPDFATSHQFFLQYTTGENAGFHTRVSRFTMAADGLTASSAATPICYIDQPNDTHKGGTIHFRDGHLYMALGDGRNPIDSGAEAQDPLSLLGKVLRIDTSGDDFPADPDNNYAVPADNPFVGTAGVRGEIWDFGLRNPFRWSVDSQTGAFLIADVGESSYEEVNYEPSNAGGRNYGWRLREGFHPSGLPGLTYPIAFTNPYFEYSHAVGSAVVGGFVVRSAGLGVTGRYLVADYISNHLWAMPVGPAVSNIGEATDILVSGGWNGIVSLDPDSNGQPVVTELNAGRVSRIEPAP